jgi:hypothetical protein
MRSGAAEKTPCARPGCEVICVGRTCSDRCRAALWKVETGYKDRRSARQRGGSRRSQVRYALVEVRGSTLEVLGFAAGKSRRGVERLFGISEHDDLVAIAERHLPEVV